MAKPDGHPVEEQVFDPVPRRRRAALRRGAVRVELEAGDVLFAEGHEGHEFVIVLGGAVEVRRGGAAVATLGPGDFLGEGALLDRTERNAGAVATKKTELLVLGEDDFEVLRRYNPALADAVTGAHAARRPGP